MTYENRYDVSTWPVGDPLEDIGEVLNSIIADVHQRQSASTPPYGGKPGAVIYIPPGDYRLRTQVLIDISFLRIEGSGHGFTSSSIRFNVPEDQWEGLHELWPGGSRILVDIPRERGDDTAGAAFRVERSGDPRISSVEFVDFCLDGLHFQEDESDLPAENTYSNGKTGILVASPNDSFRISGMGFVYLENALTIYKADALSVQDNFIAECGSCIELKGWGQASKINDNFIGAGFKGESIYAENHGGLLIAGNNVFPRGSSSVHLHGVTRSSVTGNRLHSFYPGMLRLSGNSSENLIATNHFLRDLEPWTPFHGINNGLDDDYGLINIDGSDNSVVTNHLSLNIDGRDVTPSGSAPVVIRLRNGVGNFVSNNHVVATHVDSSQSDSCFEGQVDSLLSKGPSGGLEVVTVSIEASSERNTVLDSGRETEILADRSVNALRITPEVGG
ncbi:NosD domain-containing protein [Zhihengliuella flava]|uniref:Inulin fructotransferase (DFA-I-forming) n=1 Tax=Zhihengliuella flava TaxID=1285193 RepID=A0A931DA67_9MICC|nr:NosD domain-containing protein [Zhihengliuella flava]MBG6085282.1 inulin fructotransferase (DFA-I-forming) [Zhihengliuella flava]